MHVLKFIRCRLADPVVVAILGGGVLLAFLGLFGPVLLSKAQKPYSIDFVALYVSGVQLFEGKDVYANLPFDILGPIPEGVRVPDRNMNANLNPPFSILLLSPLSRFTYTHAYLAWSLISLACAAAAAWLLAGAHADRQSRFIWTIGLLVLLLCYSPAWYAIALGQTTFPLLLLLAAGWRMSRSGHEPAAGIVLGTTLAMKPFVGLLLVYFLALRRWRLLAWYGGGFVTANLAALAVMGFDVFLKYIRILGGVTWHGMPMNASIFGFLARLSVDADGHPFAVTGYMSQVLAYGISLLLICSVILLSRRLPAWPSQQGIDIGYAYCLVLMLMISPLGWIYYFPILLISVLVIFREARIVARPWLLYVCVGACWLVSGALYFVAVASPRAKIPYTGLHVPDVYTATLILIAVMLVILGIAAGNKYRAMKVAA